MADPIAESTTELDRYCPRMQYRLLEEHAEAPEKLAGMHNLAALVFRFEQCRTRDEFERVAAEPARWFHDAARRDSARRILGRVFRLLGKRTVWDEPADKLQELREYGAMLEEQIKERETERIEKGIELGIERGVQKGITKGEVQVLLRLLGEKFGEVSQEFRERVETAGSQELLWWAERTLSAERIEDVFED